MLIDFYFKRFAFSIMHVLLYKYTLLFSEKFFIEEIFLKPILFIRKLANILFRLHTMNPVRLSIVITILFCSICYLG